MTHRGIDHVANALWEECGGAGRQHADLYGRVLASVASFLSCLAEDIDNPEYAATETLGGLINNLRRDLK